MYVVSEVEICDGLRGAIEWNELVGQVGSLSCVLRVREL